MFNIIKKLCSGVIYIVKTLCFAVKEMFRRPNILKKVGIFISCSGLLWIGSYISASCIVQKPFLSWLLHWIWIPLSVLFLVMRHGHILKRNSLKRFFERKNFVGIDGRFPTYIKEDIYNCYLKKIRFKLSIPLCNWKELTPFLEMFFKKKIYKIKNHEEDITMLDIFVIIENLPHFILWSDSFIIKEGQKFSLGEGYNGPVIWDAAIFSHGIIAGATGGSKTSMLRCIIHQAIQKKFNVSILDFKQGGDFVQSEKEYHKYKDLEAGYGPMVISEPEEARNVLVCLLVEVRGRLARFKEAGVTNIDEFNALGREQFLPWLLVIDEAAEILDVKPKVKEEKELYDEIEKTLRTLARISRAAGVHILLGIIRPDSLTLSGSIKNNMSLRACSYFADSAASEIVLGNDLATKLSPDIKGRFMIGEEEIQAYYLPLPSESKN